MPECPDCGSFVSNMDSHKRNYCTGGDREDDDE